MSEVVAERGKQHRAGAGASRDRLGLAALVGPSTLILGLTFIAPLVWLIRMSLNRGHSGGVITKALTLDSYISFLTDPYFLLEIWHSARLGLIVTAIAAVLAYPLALFLTRTTSRWRGLFFALAVAPLLTSQVVRTYGWLVLLGRQGLVNKLLDRLGYPAAPLALTNNLTGVVIALVEIIMPYMILAMVAGFGRLDRSLEAAAAGLGASPVKVFLRVTLPLSLPGVLTGCLLSFVLTISSFVTPSLVGGGRVSVMATEVYEQATSTLNWPLAASISVVLLICFSSVIVLYQRAIGVLRY